MFAKHSWSKEELRKEMLMSEINYQADSSGSENLCHIHTRKSFMSTNKIL